METDNEKAPLIVESTEEFSVNLNQFSCMFGFTDTIRLIMASDEVIGRTRTILATFWPIKKIVEEKFMTEIKLWGTPFYPSHENDVKTKYFLCQLFKEYFFLGWHFKLLTDLQRNDSCATSLIFEKKTSLLTNTICLSLNQLDKIQVFAADNICEDIKEVIVSIWPLSIQTEEIVDYGSFFLV